MPGNEFKMDSKFGDSGNLNFPFRAFITSHGRQYSRVEFLAEKVEQMGPAVLVVWRAVYSVEAGMHVQEYGHCPRSDKHPDEMQALAYAVRLLPAERRTASRWKVERRWPQIFTVMEKTPAELAAEERKSLDASLGFACDSFGCTELKKVIEKARKPRNRL